MSPFLHALFAPRRRFASSLAFAIALGLVVVAGASAQQRFVVSKTVGGGSGGATTFLQSSTGSALQGEVGSAANTAIKTPFGVLGSYDLTTGPAGVGVGGTSAAGYGVGAEVMGANPAMYARGGTGDAIDAYAFGSGNAISATSTKGYAIYGLAPIPHGIGAFLESYYSYALQAQNIYGEYVATFTGSHSNGIDVDVDTGDAVDAFSNGFGNGGGTAIVGNAGGYGVIGMGGNKNAASVSGVDTVGDVDLLRGYAYNGGMPTESFAVQSSTANASGHTLGAGIASDVQISGDLYVSGKVYKECNTFPETSAADCDGSANATDARTANGATVHMYGARQSTPTIEAVGTARLIEGHASIALDPALAATMSSTTPYEVFVTPSGPSRGLYVAAQTMRGFEVFENPGGRSTLTFAYRVVATPIDAGGERLPARTPRRSAFVATSNTLMEKTIVAQRDHRDRARYDRLHAPKPSTGKAPPSIFTMHR